MLELKTIFVYSAVINMAVALVATIAWAGRPKQKDILFWCLAAWMIVLGGIFMSGAGVLPYHLAEYIGGLLYVSSTGMLRLGFLDFHSRPYRLIEAFVVGFAVCLCLALLPDNAWATSARIALLYAGSAINLAMTAKALWEGKENERLPARFYATCTFTGYALANLFIVPLSFLRPVHFINGLPVSDWLGLTSILLVLFNMACFLMAVIVKLERSGETQRQLAERDVLTGVLNRRMFLERAEAYSGRGGALAMIDLDHFKRINDTYGHVGGDDALVQFTRLIEQRLPDNALLGRLGGEEFGLYLDIRHQASAFALLETLRSALAATQIESRGHTFPLTMSCGFVMMNDAERDLDSWLVDADCALYAVKNTGRNRVMAFDPAALLRSHAAFAEVEAIEIRLPAAGIS
jgi:diguanylate cyclase (GGDEF)-like protein